ncbi:MAG: diguanylate cyclase (GGDEF)-like protein [Pirellulaceae bacterium]|jgi:diguanylate cyclase (GGDEF)-like protein
MVIQVRVTEAAKYRVSAPRTASLVAVAAVFVVLAFLLGTSALGQQNEWQQVRESVLKSSEGSVQAAEMDSFGKIVRDSDESMVVSEEGAKQTTFNYAPFIVGVVSAVSLLSLGIGIGYYLPRTVATQDREQVDAEYVLNLLGGVGVWTHSLGEEMKAMRSMVDELVEQVGDVGDVGPDGQSREAKQEDSSTPNNNSNSHLDTIVAQLSSANARLGQRIEAAETSIKSHEADVVSYMNEARRDSLTSLPNRRAFDDHIEHRLAEWRRYGVPVSLMMIDIDFFKSINDRYGHLAGDSVLREVSLAMVETMRESDIVTRYGGEEFAVILPSTSARDACLAAERFRLAIEERGYQYEGQQLFVTISCGTAQAMSSDDAESLMRRSDEALYAAKQNGRNRAYVHDGDQSLSVYDYLGTTPELAKSAVRAEVANAETSAQAPQVPSELNSLCDDLRRRLHEIVDQS